MQTQLRKLVIKKFRALDDVSIELGSHITVICGKNGTSKSSILGIAAQIFSFEKDYTTGSLLKYQTITGVEYKSKYSEHFRISDRFDLPGSMDVQVELFDGYTNKDATAELGLFKRGSVSRPVVRKNSTVESGNKSRNFTHPVIFLSLKRLYPIANRDYKKSNFIYLNTHLEQFIGLTNELLNRSSSAATSTTGIIHSAVAHGHNYDQDSVSAGEDNAGQLMLALMSFRKLKEDYANYHGGLLLIDEADAGLFPAAQTKLIEILTGECQQLNLQVIMTSHSPTLIEYTFEQSKKFRNKFKTIYLSDTFGKIQAMHDLSWAEINADLHTKTISIDGDTALPCVNIYFEDKEGFDLFKHIMFRHPANKFINPLENITLGCSNYIQLAKVGIPEFSRKSIICLDADVSAAATKSLKSILRLPGTLPPDQLLFEYLYNLPADHEIWTNPIHFTRPVLTRITSRLMSTLGINEPQINLSQKITEFRTRNPEPSVKLRELFKDFYKETDFQALLKHKNKKFNPWYCWIKDNKTACDQFILAFIKQLKRTMNEGHYVDKSKLITLGDH